MKIDLKTRYPISNMAAMHMRCSKNCRYKLFGWRVQLLIANIYLVFECFKWRGMPLVRFILVVEAIASQQVSHCSFDWQQQSPQLDFDKIL